MLLRGVVNSPRAQGVAGVWCWGGSGLDIGALGDNEVDAGQIGRVRDLRSWQQVCVRSGVAAGYRYSMSLPLNKMGVTVSTDKDCYNDDDGGSVAPTRV